MFGTRRISRKALAAVISGALVLGLVIMSGLAISGRLAGASGGRRTIPGHLIPSLRQAQAKHATDSSFVLNLSIGLTLRNDGQLNALIAAQGDKHSPLYHHYLTPEQFKQQFSPTQANVDTVVAFLRSQGLTVQSVSPNNTLISASGSVAKVESAFETQIVDFSLDGRTVYAPTQEPSVPEELGNLITYVGGLNNVGVFRPAGLHSPVTAQRQATGPGGGFTPSELRTAYDMHSLISSADGTGQTVAIFELDGYLPADVDQYLSFYGLGAPKYSNVLVDGATNTPGAGAIEVELDMEVVSAIAPGATQKIYIGPNSFGGVIDTYNKIVTDNIAKVTSTSWGICELSAGTAFLTSLDNVFAQGAAQGQAVFAASGDYGAYDCRDGSTLNVDSPAGDPYVVGVGGTHLNVGGGGAYSSESVWASNPYGGGGGLSSFFAKPSYQTGPGVNNAYSTGKREAPDVSADADPNSGYSEYCTAGSDCGGAGWFEIGGTSAAAPLWAGIAADTNQYLAANSAPGLGSASAALYALFNTPQKYAAYHDITSGSNLYYPATADYDLASGIGTPDVWNFARDALGFPHAQVTPGAVAVTTALATNAPTQTVTLQNTGGGPFPLNWSVGWASSEGGAVGALPSWVSVSPSSGSLAPGASQTLTVTFTTSGYASPQTLTGFLTLTDPHADVVTTFTPVTVVLANVAKTWYFGEGYTGAGFSEFLTLANPNSAAAAVQVSYLLDVGAPLVKTYSVPANNRATVYVNGEVPAGRGVSMVVSANLPIVAERPMYFTYTGHGGLAIPGGTDVLGATALGTQYDFGYLDTAGVHDTFLTILNPQSAPLSVTIHYYPSAGGAPTTVLHSVPAHSRGTVFVASEGLPAGRYGALVTLSAPGLVERPMYLVDGVTGYTGSADVVGVPQLQTSWYFAEGYTSATFSERYILFNPSSATTSATVTFLKSDGSTLAQGVTLAAGAQVVVDANSVLGSAGVNNSVRVTAAQPILAERFMSFRFAGAGPIPGATEVIGAPAPGYAAYFAEGYTGGQFSEFLTLENPDPTSTAYVLVKYLPATGGAPTLRVYAVAAHSRATVYTNAEMPGQAFSMVVQSGMPIVAERPMYFAFNGTQTGGSDVVGYQPTDTPPPTPTPVPPTPTPTITPTDTPPPTPTPVPPTPTPSNFIFADHFSGSSLSSAWTIVNRHGEYAQDETECNVPGAVSVANNLLSITTTAQSATCGDFNLDASVRHSPTTWPYTTGDVQWTSLAFTYGTITYRAKFPPQNTGTWPAIWLLGSNCQATNIVTADTGYSACPALQAPGYVEIDMTECFGNTWCQLALAQPSSWPTCDYSLDSTWHTFTFSWTASAISLSMDGQPTGCGFSAADGYIIPSTPMFLLIQTQAGGIGGAPNDSNLPAILQVASVTVSQP
jgi:hypothetical protein